MPTIFRQGGFRFFFYSNEGDPREPVHVHAVSADGEAKFWVGAEVELARSAGLNSKTLRKLVQIVVERQEDIKAFRDIPESLVRCLSLRSNAKSDAGCFKFIPKRCNGAWYDHFG